MHSFPPFDYDAVLLVSFGGPEGPDDVMPFLENVVRGKNVPHQRLIEVARHYERFDGVSPINSQNRALLAALVAELNANGPQVPVYWGNRHWHPMLEDAVAQMAEDGIRRALAFVTSPFGSPPGCRQYLDAIERARQAVGVEAPTIDKLRLFYNHPGFIESMADRVSAALSEIPLERRERAKLIFTAHSIPTSMAAASPYEHQLREACRLVASISPRPWGEGPGVRAVQGSEFCEQETTMALPPASICPHPNPLPKGEGTRLTSPHPNPLPKGEGTWQLAYQSRSGPPTQPWLGPDILESIRRLHDAESLEDIVVAPIGFMAEHVEVIYDLDVEAAELCDSLGVNMVRAGTVANHPRLVRMIRELIVERMDPATPRLFLGGDGPWPDRCPEDCCRNARRS